MDEVLKRLSSHKGVEGSVIVNYDGVPIRTSFDHDTTNQYANMATLFTEKTVSTVKDLDQKDSVKTIRLRSKQNEVVIAPGKEYILVVVQKPQVE